MNIFFNNLPIYYINLDRRTDRNTLMLQQFEELDITNFKKISAIDATKIVNSNAPTLSKQHYACTSSHIMALIEFLHSGNEYAMICEDDVDLRNSLKLSFNFKELFDIQNAGCLQTCIVLREEDTLTFNIIKRSPWYFSTASYIIDRPYAKKILDLYYYRHDAIDFDLFMRYSVPDPRGGTFNIEPTADQLMYDVDDTNSFPIFTVMLTASDILGSDECARQFIKSRNDFINYWSKYEIVNIDDIEVNV